MAFITRLSANGRRCEPYSPFRLLFRLKSSLKRLPACVLALALLALPLGAAAEGIKPTRREAVLTADGRLSISSRFQTDLPDQLKDALQQGVPLEFLLSYKLEKPTLAAYRFRVTQLISNENTVGYKLSYHPLTRRYRITVGTFSTEYNSLQTALKAVGAIANWKVLNKDALTDIEANEIKAQIRLNLSMGNLPKPFQINALTSKSWNLDSGWQTLQVKPQH